MMVLSEMLRNARLDLIAAALDGADAPGRMHIYDGIRPDPGLAITTQALLADIALPRPLAPPAQNGVLEFHPVAESLALATGIATWVRLTNGDGLWVADGDVGLMDSGADVELDDLELYRGGTVSVLAAILSE